MFCQHCGSNIDDHSTVCPHCGVNVTPIAPAAQPTPAPTYNPAPALQDNTIALVGFIMAFIIPFVGLICSIIGYNKAKNGGFNHKDLAVAGIVISALSVVGSVVIFFINLVVILGAMGAAGSAGYALLPFIL